MNILRATQRSTQSGCGTLIVGLIILGAIGTLMLIESVNALRQARRRCAAPGAAAARGAASCTSTPGCTGCR